ncbi:glycosyltransferase family 2 protein [Lachnobacterium bovis]|uniref:glycosyltransferase family 2 protein n=1 Tax=Lachnobacterium bovis TaxID=140626 RepID=UPI00068AB0D4|nr:glycosyltransferase family 2 protein [Lachnobacterium bovis]
MDDKTKIKVSIIVPVYNAEKTLIKAIGSILKQTLEEIEIICVNDASHDNSIEILRQLKNISNGKMIIIDSDVNMGAGGARNLALDVARGEYIGFVDSDDYIVPVMFEKLYKEAKKGDYDIVDSGFYKESEDVAILYTSDELKGELNGHKRSELIVSGGFLWSKIFKRELFEFPKLRMRKNAILEDADVLTYLFATAKNIGTVKEILYGYVDSNGSLSKEKNAIKYYDNVYNAIDAIYEKTHNLENYKEIQMAVEYEIIQLYSYGVNICIANLNLIDKNEVNDKKEINAKIEMEVQKRKDVRQKEDLKKEWNNRLNKLVELKNKITCIDIEQNIYVKNKINKDDIEIMESVEKKEK